MNLIVIDLDMTLVDTKSLIASGGPEPVPGTPEHDAWVKHVTNPSILLAAPAVSDVLRFIHTMNYLHDQNLVFITSRRESMRQLTTDWLSYNLLSNKLYMRGETDLRSSGEFKADVIRSLTDGPVLVVDDDPDGSMEQECKSHGWTHFKVTTYATEAR